MKTTLLSAAAMTALTIGAVNAATLSIDAFEDITLDQGDGNQNGRDHLLVGNNANNGPYNSLVVFDLSGRVNIGAGQKLQINSVTISFWQSASPGAGDPFDFEVKQYNHVFDPTTSTYAVPAPGDSTAGGDGTGTSFGTVTIATPNAAIGTQFPDLATSSDLESALQSGLTAGDNFRIRLSATSAPGDVGFIRLDRSTGANPIQLNVDYDIIPVPEPSSAALLGLGGLALILRRRKG